MSRECLCIAVAALLMPAAALATSHSLLTAEAMQDEGATDVDVSYSLIFLDGSWSPSDVTPVNGVDKPYYATGGSAAYFDGINLTFDVSGTPAGDMTLWVFLRKGTYVSNDWEHYLLLPGLDNPAQQDNGVGASYSNPDAVDILGSDGDQLASGSLYGWLGIPFNTASETDYLNGDNAEMTLRLWNWQVDAVSLVSGQGPPELIPEPLTLLGVSCGLAGLGRYIRRRRTA